MLQPRQFEEFLVVLAQVQDHLGAAVELERRLDREFALSVGFPTRAVGATALAQHRDLVGDDVRRLEADAELADKLRTLLLVAGPRLYELARAGTRERAEVFEHRRVRR